MFTITIDVVTDDTGKFFRARSADFDAALKKWGYQSENPFVFYSRDRAKIVADAFGTMLQLCGELVHRRLPLDAAPDEIRTLISVQWEEGTEA